MSLKVVGAGVGRTGTNSLKIALEQLLGQPCHHMFEICANPSQIPEWTAAIEGQSIDWSALLEGYGAQVDWPGASFWPELSHANPEALVLLSVRDPEAWYRSASNTIFQVFDAAPPEMRPWFETVGTMLKERFSDQLDKATARYWAAMERHKLYISEHGDDMPEVRDWRWTCLLYTSPSPRDRQKSRMPSSA